VSTTPAKNLSPVSTTPTTPTTPVINSCHGFSVIAGVIDTGNKFITSEQFIAGVIDTGEKFITVVVDTGCCAHGTFRCFELCSTCSREGLGRSKPTTNSQNKHINTTVGISTISKHRNIILLLSY
jgi:hypothetical protein